MEALSDVTKDETKKAATFFGHRTLPRERTKKAARIFGHQIDRPGAGESPLVMYNVRTLKGDVGVVYMLGVVSSLYVLTYSGCLRRPRGCVCLILVSVNFGVCLTLFA